MTHSQSYRSILNKLGYYNYQQGIIYRHLNQDDGWNSHLDNCRQFILKALDFHKPDKVSVLGSGWLLDLPLAEMVEITKSVCLIDIIHPPDVIKQVSNIKQVELVEQDLTGGLIEELWQKTAGVTFFRKLKTPEDLIIPEYKPAEEPGMIISLNILTQLETLLVNFLKRKIRADEGFYYRFRAEIQRKHIDFLKKHKSVLITDQMEVFTDRTGNVTNHQSVITELPQGSRKEEWTWDFDLKGSDYYKKKSVMEVVAIIL